MQSLERRGLVRQVDAEGPVTYELTDAGRGIELS
jgi:chromosome segregation and condensation protein ScpB